MKELTVVLVFYYIDHRNILPHLCYHLRCELVPVVPGSDGLS